jgi:dephospho-CoA kinase
MSSDAAPRRWRQGPKPTIGLIGGIGAGKSTAAAYLAARGGAVIDADALGHAALQDAGIRRRVLEKWGVRVLKPDGSLDRRAIAAIVFADPAERDALERLVFPYIAAHALDRIGAAQLDPASRFVVVDAAVMLEAGWNNVVDRTVYIDAPRDTRLARLAARSGWTDSDLARREAAQWPEDVKKARSDAVLVNDAAPEAMHRRIDRLLAEWGIQPGP